MKKLVLFSFICGAATLFQSCDKLGFEFDQTFDKTFDVNIKDNQNGSGDFTSIQTIDVNDGDLKENLDKIDELEIKSIKIEFSDYTGADTAKVNGSIQFPQILSNSYALPELNIHDMAANSEALILYEKEGASFPDDASFPANDFVNGLITFLKTLPADQLSFNYTANSTDYPIDFKAKILLDVFVKVNPTE